MDKISLIDLKKIHIFNHLENAEVELSSSLLQHLHLLQGEYIIREATTGDHIYILMQGTVKVTKELVKGIESKETGDKMLATLTSDCCPTFGENGLLGENPRSANVIAVTDCELYTISQKDFDKFALDNPVVAYKIMRNIAIVLSERLVTTDENVVKLATALFIAVSR
jgi:CRP-like cAMP-binding protein